MDVSQSTFNQSTEYLVHYGFFEALMTRNGFKLVKVGQFQHEYAAYKGVRLEADEKELSFLNKYFIFEKVEHVKVVVSSTKFSVKRVGSAIIKPT